MNLTRRAFAKLLVVVPASMLFWRPFAPQPWVSSELDLMWFDEPPEVDVSQEFVKRFSEGVRILQENKMSRLSS